MWRLETGVGSTSTVWASSPCQDSPRQQAPLFDSRSQEFLSSRGDSSLRNGPLCLLASIQKVNDYSPTPRGSSLQEATAECFCVGTTTCVFWCIFSAQVRRSIFSADSKAAAFWWRKEQRTILKKKVEELSHTNKHADAALTELNTKQKVSGN